MRRRLDGELVRRGLAGSRAAAQAAIASGRVLVAGSVAEKAARQVHAGEPIELVGPPPRFVSRGGEKLDAALARFAVPVAGRVALDAGASTGGFPDCLLQRGAAGVVAIDVGYGQLHERLRADPRVTVHERQDVRTFPAPPGGFPLVCADLAFISLRTVAPDLARRLAAPDADIVVLVKPQFETDHRLASKGRGVIRDPDAWRRALGDVASAMEAERAAIMGAMVSPLTGADGNVEFLVHVRAHPEHGPLAPVDLDAVVDEAAARGGTEH